MNSQNRKEKASFISDELINDLLLQMNTCLSNGILDEQVLYGLVERYAVLMDWPQTLAALPFAREKHSGQIRLGGHNVPYFCHPLMVAVHAIALGAAWDELTASALLHDVCEDCGISPEELPVVPSVQETVRHLTRNYDPKVSGRTTEGEREYYAAIESDPTAVLVKLLDRCSNVSSMSGAFSSAKVAAYLEDTRKWVLPLFEKAMHMHPEFSMQIFLVRYHICSVMETIEEAF